MANAHQFLRSELLLRVKLSTSRVVLVVDRDPPRLYSCTHYRYEYLARYLGTAIQLYRYRYSCSYSLQLQPYMYILGSCTSIVGSYRYLLQL